MKNNKLILVAIFLLAISVAIFLFFTKDKKTKVFFQFGEKISQRESASEAENQEAKEIKKKNPAENDTINKSLTELKQENFSVKEKKQNDFQGADNLINWGFENASNRKIDTIVIHSSYNALGGNEYDFKKLLQEYKKYGVAPHYVIDRKGNVQKLVEEKNIAYHAGESKTPDGRTSVNNFSIGIEIMCTKSESPNDAQYKAIKNLIFEIKNRYKIKYILGHNQIAPDRKDDPWNFDWKKI